MKIQAEVSLYVVLADGRRVSVSHTVNRTAGDNPRLAPGEALEALTEAQTAALRGFAAQIGQDAPKEAPELSDQTPFDLPTDAPRRRKLREYTVNALDTAEVPLNADATQARRALLAAGLNTYATDAELESFQALRVQTRVAENTIGSLRVDSLISLLDGLDAGNGLGPAELGDLLLKHGHQVPEHDVLRLASNIRHARKDPER